MIVFNVKADGTVDTMPSIVPQASSLADIVVLSAYDYAYCYLHLTPPSGVYIPDVVCTPVLTTDRQVTLWTAPMPAEVTKIGGNVGYTIYFKAKDGTTQRTNPGTFPVPRTEISTVNEDGKFIKRVVTKDDEGNDVVSTVAVDETNYGEIYQVIADIYQAFVSLNREQLENTNLLEVLDDLLQGYNRDPDENRTGAVMASVKAVDQKVETNKTNITANAAAIAADAKKISTNTQNLTALTSKINDPAHGLSAVETKLANFLDVSDDKRDQLSEVLGLISANADAIETFKNMGGAPVGSGTLVVPMDQWSDETPTGAMVALPANTMGAGSVMLLTPANGATKEAASKSRLTVSVDISGDSGGNTKDYVVLLRAETAAKPAIDMEFAYVILQTTATTSLVTLIGVDAAGDPAPTLVDLSGFEGVEQEDGSIKGVIVETYADETTRTTEVTYDGEGNIVQIGATKINWGGEA